jgi:hypothetical protein
VRKNPLDMGLRTKKYNIKIKWRRNKTDRKKALSNREISDIMRSEVNYSALPREASLNFGGVFAIDKKIRKDESGIINFI